MQNYIQGQGYSHGYEARVEGREMPDVNEIGLYWDEYRAGWFDAHRVILENARRDYQNTKKKLDENSEQQQFLQD
jgi:hypothetical protein